MASLLKLHAGGYARQRSIKGYAAAYPPLYK
jgi:hypothetical protein